MLNLNFLNLEFFFSNLIFIMVRIFFVFFLASIFDDILISNKIKFLLSFLITLLVMPFIFPVYTVLFSINGVFLIIQQIIIGILIGFIIQLMFVVSNIIGEILVLQMGLSISNFFYSEKRIYSSIISRFLYLFIFFLFLYFNGHLWIIFIIVKSFYIIPIKNIYFSNDIFYFIINYINKIYKNGVIFSFPIILFLFILNILIGLISRLCSQLSIFSFGLPILLLFSIIIFYFSIPIIDSFLIYCIKYLLN